MDDYLTADIDRADALVDLSNVVRNSRLGGSGAADLTRLDRVAKALAELHGATDIALYAVSDQSLIRGGLFSNSDQFRLTRRWADERLIEVEGKADVRLLQIAEVTGLPIITGDRFRGHRRDFSWLDGRGDVVLEPYIAPDRRVALRRVTMIPVAAWDLSASEESDVLVQQGLGTGRNPRFDVLGRLWGCPETHCVRHDPRRSRYVLLPRWRDGRVFCDQHGLDMVDLGPRPLVMQIKLLKDDREIQRFTVLEGSKAIVGRQPPLSGLNVSPWLDSSGRLHVSRSHLVLSLEGERLVVRDTSANGTLLVLKDGKEVMLHRGDEHRVSLGDRMVLLPGLELVRSGRRFPAELAADRSVIQEGDQAEDQTTVN
ncbi:FHA domain-containing protein [Streptosporangium sp. NPDC002544]|uniref:FHA domain-containing protein n=1 Tax=Streptosporangium sp. NPDC002544 TaxID=3154538 RepID=UPI00332B571E